LVLGYPAGTGRLKETCMTIFAAEVSSTGVHWAWTALALLAVPALVALDGFFVAAELALVAVPKTRDEEMVGQGVSRESAVQEAGPWRRPIQTWTAPWTRPRWASPSPASPWAGSASPPWPA